MLKLHLKKLSASSLLRFAVTGVLNTVVGLGTIYALKWFWQVADTPANLMGYLVGVTFSLIVNSRWTFRSRASLTFIAPRYLTVIVFAYCINLAMVKLCIQQLQINSYVAHAVGTIPYAVITYLLLRWWVFRQPGITPEIA